LIVHYGEYLSLKERSKKLLEGESLEGKKLKSMPIQTMKQKLFL